MNLNVARSKVKEMMGIPHKFIYTGLRNQVDEFEGVILNCYPALFIVEVSDSQIKSFSYSDFILKNIRILS